MSLYFSRRNFLKAGYSAVGAAVLSKWFTDVAEGRVIRGAVSSVFNGGRSQVNPNFLFNGGEYPFLNMFKTADPIWGGVGGVNSPITPDMLDSNGYPTTLTNTLGVTFSSGIYMELFVTPQSVRPGNWVVTWDGNGTIYCAAGDTPVSGSKVSSTGSGRYVFSTATNDFLIGVAAIGSPRITNIKVFHIDDEAAVNAGLTFGTQFKQRLLEGKFGAIRFHNWMASGGSNFSNQTNWLTRKPVTYATYSGFELRSNIYCGVTTNSGNSYSVGFPAVHSSDGTAWSSGGPKDGDTITLVFNASATTSGACDLNIGSTGAVNILGSDCGPLSSSATRYPVGGTYQSLATLVYKSVLSAWVKRGGDLASAGQGLNNGCPPEIMLQLCREVGSDPWFPCPTYTFTPATDYAPKLIELIKSSNPAWTRPWIEPPNELWNPIFLVSLGYAGAVATAYGWGSDSQNWYGKALSELGQIASFMYGADATKYRIVCGVQVVSGASQGNIVNNDPRLSSAKFVANTGGLQTSETLTGSWGTINISASVGVAEAWRWTSHVSPANYFAPGFYGSTTETTLATAYAGGDLTAPGTYIASLSPSNSVVTLTTGTPGVVNWTSHGLSANDPVRFYYGVPGTLSGGPSSSTGYFVKTVIDPNSFTVSTTAGGTAVNFTITGTGTAYCVAATNAFTIPGLQILLQNFKAWAQGFSVNKLANYEGGYSPDYTGNSQLDNLRAAGKGVSNLQGHLTSNYGVVTGLTGGGFTGEFPSCFQLGGKTPSNSAWSVLEDVYVSLDPPQWLAIKAFNA